jgi:hypothetical protein
LGSMSGSADANELTVQAAIAALPNSRKDRLDNHPFSGACL